MLCYDVVYIVTSIVVVFIPGSLLLTVLRSLTDVLLVLVVVVSPLLWCCRCS